MRDTLPFVIRYFFIRYAEDGPHVRLRWYGDAAKLRRELMPVVVRHAEDARSTAASDAIPDVHRCAWVPYEPEVNRYGGPDGLTLAERFFHASSETALRILAAGIHHDRATHVGQALLAMLVTIHVFTPNRNVAASFSHNYGVNYLRTLARDEVSRTHLLRRFEEAYTQQADSLSPYVQEAWRRLAYKESLSDVLDAYAGQLIRICEGLKELARTDRLRRGGMVLSVRQACSAIVPSYIHMMNNRLGIPIWDEAYLACLIEKVLAEPSTAFVP